MRLIWLAAAAVASSYRLREEPNNPLFSHIAAPSFDEVEEAFLDPRNASASSLLVHSAAQGEHR